MRSSVLNLRAFIVIMMAVLPLPGLARDPEASVRLWRLDCGELWTANLDELSDTHAYEGQSRLFVGSCYLIQHGHDYLLWDAGLPRSDLGKSLVQGGVDSHALSVTLVDQLARIGVRPGQVSVLGISHYHFDHIGQAAEFPQAKLLIGSRDMEYILRPDQQERAQRLAPWLRPGANLMRVDGDMDVFGDRSVVMLALPGHTAGHHGLLVRLARQGAVLLSGDAAHMRENLEHDGVPSYNADRAQSLASMDRLRQMARNLRATLVLQHDARDLDKLPAFPLAAE